MSETSIPMETIREARLLARDSGQRMLRVLAERTGLSGDPFAAALAETVRKPRIAMAELRDLTPAFDLISFAEGMARDCQVFRDAEDKLKLVLTDPFDPGLLPWVESRVNGDFFTCIASEADLQAWQSLHEEDVRAIDSALPAAGNRESAEHAVEELSFRGIAEDASPVVRLVNSTLYDALKADASDIHLESTAGGMLIRYRLDGVLHTIGSAPTMELAQQVISRIKVMSSLDIAERRIPQDGRFRVSVNGEEVDLRVSIMPSIHGEDAVLRILDKKSLADQIEGLTLTSLGFDRKTAALLRHLASEPYGMFLVTGPTGSGKTTTLYAAISETNKGDEKIVTIEDPVEYQLPGVLQIPVNERKGLTFARGLRSILRHDPDKIMVGEIRDAETANIAIQSALTGHLVFTTVHANNVFDVLGRFMHMEVDPYSFVSALNGILAQRLVRVNCPHCAQPYVPSDDLLAESGLSRSGLADFNLLAGKGCGHCRGSGFKGRTTIAEILRLTDEIRELIIGRAPIRTIKEAARASGTRFLRGSALDLVRQGRTTLQEINRVTFVA